jgi:hypothetical protein
MDELSRRRDWGLVDRFEWTAYFLYSSCHCCLQLLAPLPFLCGAERVIRALGARDRHTMRVALLFSVVQRNAARREVEEEDVAVMEVRVCNAEVWHSRIEDKEVACVHSPGVKVLPLQLLESGCSWLLLSLSEGIAQLAEWELGYCSRFRRIEIEQHSVARHCFLILWHVIMHLLQPFPRRSPQQLDVDELQRRCVHFQSVQCGTSQRLTAGTQSDSQLIEMGADEGEMSGVLIEAASLPFPALELR